MAEVCNVHSPAIEIEPIHRVVFGVSAKELYAALDAWDRQQGSSTIASDQRLRLADACGESAVALANPPAPLTVGSVEAFLADYLPLPPRCNGRLYPRRERCDGIGCRPRQAPPPPYCCPIFAKADLFKGVVLGGVLPPQDLQHGPCRGKTILQ